MDAGLNIVIGADVNAAVAGLDKVNTSLDKTAQSAAAVSPAVTKAVEGVNKIPQATKEASITIADMRDKLKELKAELETTTGGHNIQVLNVQIKGLEDAIHGATTVAKPAAESFEKMRTVFEDVGHVLEGKDITIRSFAQNFALLGPAVTVAAAAIAFLGAELYKYASESNTAEQAQQLLNKTMGEAAASTQGEIAETQILIGVVTNETNSRKLRNDAFQELQDKYPNALKNMSLETTSLVDLQKATDHLTEALIRQAEIKGLEGAIADIAKQEADLMTQTTTGFLGSLNIFDKLRVVIGGIGGGLGSATTAGEILGEQFEKNNVQFGLLNTKLKELITTSLTLGDNDILGGKGKGGGATDNSLSDLQKYIADSAKIRADAEEKEIISENDKYKKIYDDLVKFHHDTQAATEQHQKNLADIQNKYIDLNNGIIAKAFAEEKAKQLKAEQDGNLKLQNETEAYIAKSETIGKSATEKAIEAENEKYKKLLEAHMLGDGQIEEIERQHQANLKAIADAGQESADAKQIEINVANFKINFDKNLASDAIKKATNEVLQHIQNEKAAGNIDIALKISAHIPEEIKKQFLLDVTDQVRQLVVKASAAAVEGIGTVIGNIASGIKNPFESVLKTIGGLLGDGLIQIGKQLIEASAIMIAIQKAVAQLGTIPEVGLLVGIAAIAAGTVLKNAVTTTAAHAFADGGIITGPTLGLVGEAGPEVIFPLSKLNDFVKNNTQGAGGYMPEVRLKGADMIIAFNRAQGLQNRV